MTGVPPRRRAALGVTHERDHRKTVRARDVDRHYPQHARGTAAMKVVPGAAGFVATAAGRPADAALALAIGNFDGVHLGHAALLAEARARAARRGGQSAVLTFTPHPARLFAPDRAPPLIMSLERRLELCAEAGIDVAIVEPFTRALRGHRGAGVRARRAGPRSRRARRRRRLRLQLRPRPRRQRGDARRSSGPRPGIDVAVIPPIAIDGVPCSSTRIRELVAAGDTIGGGEAARPSVRAGGAVVRGAGRGRGLGFPTANVAAEGELRPKLGHLRGARAGARRPARGHGARRRPQRRHESTFTAGEA